MLVTALSGLCTRPRSSRINFVEQAGDLLGREHTRIRKSPLLCLTRATGPDTSFMTTSPPDEASESPLDTREGAMLPLSPGPEIN